MEDSTPMKVGHCGTIETRQSNKVNWYFEDNKTKDKWQHGQFELKTNCDVKYSWKYLSNTSPIFL